MKYEELVEMWEKDAKVDTDRIDHFSLNLPLLQGKYFTMWLRERAVLRHTEIELKLLKKWKRDYFLGEISPEELAKKGVPAFARRVVKDDVALYIDTDADVVAHLKKLVVVQTKVDFLDLCVKALNDYRWSIKNAIDFWKFKNGGS